MMPFPQDFPHPFGDYTLTRLIESGNYYSSYAAYQNHVERPVLLTVLSAQAPKEVEEAFRLRAREQAQENTLPHTVQMLDSGTAEQCCYTAQELPPGTPLSLLLAEGKQLSVVQLCRIVSAAATLYSHCEEAELATLPPAARDIYSDEESGSVHFLSPLAPGTPGQNITEIRQRELARILLPLRPVGVTGEGRAATVLQWMEEGHEGSRFDWDTLRDTANTITEQLVAQGAVAPPPEEENNSAYYTQKWEQRRQRRQLSRIAVYTLGALLLAGGISASGFFFNLGTPTLLGARMANGILCQEHGKQYRVSLQPVSTAEYAAFLEALSTSTVEEQEKILHDIPMEHRPKPRQFSATDAKPITGVNYWEALACARYMGGTLPSAAMLQAALAETGPTRVWEWTTSRHEGSANGIYTPNSCLLMESTPQQIRPIPVPAPTWQHEKSSFRIAYPHSQTAE